MSETERLSSLREQKRLATSGVEIVQVTLTIQFDSLLIADGAVVPIEAAATDLDLRPLKGKVEGKNTGKNVLVRSLSGIGQAGAMVVGQRSLNQVLNESDLIRERVGSNIGEAGDEEVSRLAVTRHIVVTISSDTPIYVVLEQSPQSNQVSLQPSARSVPTSSSANIDQLRQLLRLQQELNQTSIIERLRNVSTLPVPDRIRITTSDAGSSCPRSKVVGTVIKNCAPLRRRNLPTSSTRSKDRWANGSSTIKKLSPSI